LFHLKHLSSLVPAQAALDLCQRFAEREVPAHSCGSAPAHAAHQNPPQLGVSRLKGEDSFVTVAVNSCALDSLGRNNFMRARVELVSANSRTSLPSPKSEIGKKRAETGARKPRPKD
jgi:hypothetical protein